MTQHPVRVLLFGASGMVGAGVLLECLEDPEVTRVLSVGRNELNVRMRSSSTSFTRTSPASVASASVSPPAMHVSSALASPL
jgi:hypothetical protein